MIELPEPTAKWKDPLVQTIYELICSEEVPPPPNHLDGWTARRIADAVSTYGDQRAAEAREQMREECIKACQATADRGWSYYEEERRPVLRGKALGADVCVDRIKELP